jgi:hypothetical protein
MAPRFLPSALATRLKDAVAKLPDDAARALALSALGRAERVLERLEGTAKVLDKVARTELAILERLEPIVDDLGRLVRLQLDEARRRLGGGASHSEQPPPKVIDVE